MDKVKKLKKRAKTKLSTFKTKSSQLNPIHLLFRLEILIFQDNFSPDDIGYKCQRKGTIPGRNLFKYNSCNNDEIDFSAVRLPLTVLC